MKSLIIIISLVFTANINTSWFNVGFPVFKEGIFYPIGDALSLIKLDVDALPANDDFIKSFTKTITIAATATNTEEILIQGSIQNPEIVEGESPAAGQLDESLPWISMIVGILILIGIIYVFMNRQRRKKNF